MIILLHGTDIKKLQSKFQAIVDSLRKKKPNASFVRIGENVISDIDSTFGGAGLFESNYIVSIKNITSDKEVWKEVSKKIKDMQKSNHVYVWVEGGKETAAIKKIKTVAEKSEEHNLKEVPQEQEQVFVFLDLFFSRNNKDSWVWYVNNRDVELFQILNLIMWQVKSIRLAEVSNTAEAAGLKPFVFSKSKRLTNIWNKNQLSDLFTKCLDWQTRGRQGEDVEKEFEKYILCV